MYNVEKIVEQASGKDYIRSLIEDEGYTQQELHKVLGINTSSRIIHQQNTSIVPHISETKYKNLLELLESLKSQVPDALMETYKDVEKQLGLTDNQQPST